jgi:hypothetical protein
MISMTEPEPTELQQVLANTYAEEKRLGRRLSEQELEAFFLQHHNIHLPGLADRIDVATFLKAVHRRRDDVILAESTGVSVEEIARGREEYEGK